VLVSGINHIRQSETLMGQGLANVEKNGKKALTFALIMVILAMLGMKERF
jgi:hypothetical protein